MKLSIGLNGDSGIEQLTARPHALEVFRRYQAELILWCVKGVPGEPRRHFKDGTPESANYEDLCRVDLFATLKRAGIPLVLHEGATKADDHYGDKLRDRMRKAIDGVNAAGGQVAGFTLDSPLRHGVEGRFHIPGDGYLKTIDATADVVSNFIREARERGAWCAIHDAWPYHSFYEHLTFLDALRARHAAPVRFIFDLDLQAFQYPRTWWEILTGRGKDKDLAFHYPKLRQFCGLLRDRGIEAACTIMGSGTIADAADFAAKTRDYSTHMRDAFDGSLDRIQVESWATQEGSGEHPDYGRRWIPPLTVGVVPEIVSVDQTALGLAEAVAQEWGMTA